MKPSEYRSDFYCFSEKTTCNYIYIQVHTYITLAIFKEVEQRQVPKRKVVIPVSSNQTMQMILVIHAPN